MIFKIFVLPYEIVLNVSALAPFRKRRHVLQSSKLEHVSVTAIRKFGRPIDKQWSANRFRSIDNGPVFQLIHGLEFHEFHEGRSQEPAGNAENHPEVLRGVQVDLVELQID